eukprot:481000_1
MAIAAVITIIIGIIVIVIAGIAIVLSILCAISPLICCWKSGIRPGCFANGPSVEIEIDDKWKNANTEIGISMKSAERLSKQAMKLLLIGTKDSGKSELFRSLKIITRDQNIETETAEERYTIRQNCVAGILTLLKKSQELYDENPEQNDCCFVNMDDEIGNAIQLVVNYGSESFSEVLDHNEVRELGQAIYMLWSLD